MSFSMLAHRDDLATDMPADLLTQMDVAAAAYDRLTDAGETLRFTLHPLTGRLQITLADLDGNPRARVSPSAVLDLAAGGDLDGAVVSARDALE